MEAIGIIWTGLTLAGLTLCVSAISGRSMLAGLAILCVAWAMWTFIPFHT